MGLQQGINEVILYFNGAFYDLFHVSPVISPFKSNIMSLSFSFMSTFLELQSLHILDSFLSSSSPATKTDAIHYLNDMVLTMRAG